MSLNTELNPLNTDFLSHCDELCSRADIAKAIDVVAASISRDLSDKNPVVLCVMNGGLIFCGQLLVKLGFPLQLDYLHATRYQETERGADVQWLARPQVSLKGRALLIVDDILDEGITLKAVIDYCLEQGAASVAVAVLVEKEHRRNVVGVKADYVGLTVPDRYIFGMGMDYKGLWRNTDAIYALKEVK